MTEKSTRLAGVPAITRGWLAFAAVGAGLIHFSLVLTADAVAAPVLAVVGVIEFGWGVLAMFDERFTFARVVSIAALAPTAAWVLALVLGFGGSFRPVPLALAGLLEFFVAGALIVDRRRARPASAVTTGRYLVGLAVGALLIGGITALGLAASASGQPSISPGIIQDHGH